MSYDNVEKLSAVIFRPCNNFAIKHIVQVAKKGLDGKRKYCHSEYTYLGNKYSDKKYLKSINLEFYSSILIEEQGKDWTSRESIRLHYVNLPIFIKAINSVCSWFIESEYDDLYYTEENKLRLNIEFGNLREVVRLGENKTIIFRPSVIQDKFDVRYEGIEMFVNTKEAIGYITLDNLMAMRYIFENFNLYQSSLELINYLGRPDFDEYNYDIGIDNRQNEDTFTQVSKRNNTGEMKDEFIKKFDNFFTSK